VPVTDIADLGTGGQTIDRALAIGDLPLADSRDD
jgi:hypothetical protein